MGDNYTVVFYFEDEEGCKHDPNPRKHPLDFCECASTPKTFSSYYNAMRFAEAVTSLFIGTNIDSFCDCKPYYACVDKPGYEEYAEYLHCYIINEEGFIKELY